MVNLVLATGSSIIDDMIMKKIARAKFSNTCVTQDLAIRELEKMKSGIIIISSMLKTTNSIYNFIHEIREEFPEFRIIFLCGEDNPKDIVKVTNIASIVRNGVYDIIPGKSVKMHLIQSCIDNPMQLKDVSFYIERSDELEKKKTIAVNIEIEAEDDEVEEKDEGKLIAISSIKPGTGKSFVTVNMAMGLAKYGIKKNGKRPRVAVIEGDLQTLSVGTLLKIQNKEKNLKTVMDKIDSLLDEKGNVIADKIAIEEAEKFIMSSFLKTDLADNLFALVGSELSYEEASKIKFIHYSFLLDLIVDKFDIVIFDTNSLLNHASTMPAFAKAKYIYYILNLDYNNVKNNARYRKDLKNYGLLNKIRYILNEDLTDYKSDDDLVFDSRDIESFGFHLSGKIPIINKVQFLNAISNGTPIVTIDDDSLAKIRYELLRISNEVWEIEELAKLEAKANKDVVKKKLFKW